MTSKTIFNMNSELKKTAMKKARTEGTTLSAVLNFAAEAYVKNHFTLALIDSELAKGLDDIANGRTHSLEEVERRILNRRKRS